MLEQEDNYYNKVETIMRKLEVKVKDITQLLYDELLYIVTAKHIRTLEEEIVHDLQESPSTTVSNLLDNFIALNVETLLVFNRTGPIELFNRHIGDRVGAEAGEFSCSCFYPITTLLGTVCSMLIGFKSGILMKYNFNRNPVTEEQSNLSYYQPLLPHVRTGEEPNLPNQHSTLIDIVSEKLTP
jgi:hypothetical protein